MKKPWLLLLSGRAGPLFALVLAIVAPFLHCRDEAGRALALAHCAGCHAFPEPDILPRRSWDHVLDYMGLFLAQPPRAGAHPDIEKLRADLQRQRLLPDTSTVDAGTFARIRAYYAGSSSREAAGTTPVLAEGPPFLRPRRTAVHRAKPSITLLSVRPEARRVLAADGLSRTLFELDASGRISAETKLPGPPSAAVFGKGHVDLSLLYLVDPRPREEAAIVRMRGAHAEILVGGLPRLAHLSAHDFDGDGVADHIAAGFGLFRGALFLRTSRARLMYRLDEEPGWIRSEAYDWNGDGVADLLALRAQAREGLYWIDGRELHALQPGARSMMPKVAPRLRPIVEEHPAFGFTSFALVRRKAPRADLLFLVNGDNGDLPNPPRKPYHGIRVYELLRGGSAQGTPTLRLLAFLPLPGAYKVVARDFDGDGDIDLAAIAFYPDWTAERPAGFVYYENLGGERFRAWAPEETRFGRWITLDAGDFDGDGDEDIVLGSYAHPSLPTPPDAQKLLDRRGHTVLFLENRSRMPP